MSTTPSRREFLTHGLHGLGGVALWQLLASEGLAEQAVRQVAPRARNVIFLFMMGGPSQLDLFDPKPGMAALHGQPIPDSLVKAKKSSTGQVLETVMASPRVFHKAGQSGLELSDWLPHTARVADELCVVRSLWCEQSNHDPAQLLLHCGTPLFGSPSLGSWLSYGLGSESQNLPGYLVLLSDDGHGLEGAGSALWGSGFMPSTHRGVSFRNQGDPVLHVRNPPGISRGTQRARLDVLRDLNTRHQQVTGDAEIAARIAAYEMAFRMQTAAPDLLDFADETLATRVAYGLDDAPTRPFGTNCLLARRMVERGVRFVHLVHSSWDHHSDLNGRLQKNCQMTDQPAAALVADLRQRGLLDETLVVWAGEFGRTPMGEVRRGVNVGKEGRDHHPQAFSGWLAGGGVKPGIAWGRTDDFGFHVVEEGVHVHDLQATLLHLLGIDHERLTYRFQGRNHRLTDVSGRVVSGLLA